MLKLETPAICRCMKSAARAGFDPYNSHVIQATSWAKAWKDKARRTR